MEPVKKVALLGVDWGSTHRRAYVIDSQGQCIAEHSDAVGALQCKGRFPEALTQLIAQLQIQPARIVMSGMVGSALGWQEVPYVQSGLSLNQLHKHLTPLREPPDHLNCLLVPGYVLRDQAGEPDVMRGEETQLMGAVAMGHSDGWLVLPGTHSKWVELKAGCIVRLSTFMTGELFGLLTQHGTLAAASGTTTQVWDEPAFGAGVRVAGHSALSHALFVCRARVVAGDMPAAHAHAYLSGLLIGSELHAALRVDTDKPNTLRFQLIGTPALAEHYQRAAAQMGIRLDLLDPRACYLSALTQLQSHLDGKPS